MAVGRKTDAGRRNAPSRTGTTLAFLLGDTVSAGIAAAVATVVAIAADAPLGTEGAALFVLFIATLPAMMAASGLYPGVGVGEVEEFRLVVTATTSVCIVLLSMLALLAGTEALLPGILMWASAMLLVPFGRSLVRELASRAWWWGVPVVVLGAGPAAAELIERLNRDPRGTVRPIAILDDDPRVQGDLLHGVAVRGRLEDAGRFVEEGVHHALVPLRSASWDVSALVHRHAVRFPTAIFVPDLAEVGTDDATVCSFTGLPGVKVKNHLSVRSNLVLKRLMDLILLVPAGILAFPLVGISALIVRAVNPGNPFYRQERIGLNGKPFKVWKLRTMYLDAEQRLERYLAEHPEAEREWRTRYKLTHDARILPGIGAFLRASSLDELPQLWNIARGEMSFVGPRPFPTYHLAAFDEEFRALRASVIPGLTGLWQVTSRSDSDIARQQELDWRYISNWSPWLDAYILARTPAAVVRRRGAE